MAMDKGYGQKANKASAGKIFDRETRDPLSDPDIKDRHTLNMSGEVSSFMQPYVVSPTQYIKGSVPKLDRKIDGFVDTKVKNFSLKGEHKVS